MSMRTVSALIFWTKTFVMLSVAAKYICSAARAGAACTSSRAATKLAARREPRTDWDEDALDTRPRFTNVNRYRIRCGRDPLTAGLWRWDAEGVVDTANGPGSRAPGLVEKAFGHLPPFGAQALWPGQRHLHRARNISAGNHHVRGAAQQNDLFTIDRRFLDQLRAIDDHDGTIEQHEFESDRAVVGDDDIGHEQIRRDVSAPRDVNPGMSRKHV